MKAIILRQRWTKLIEAGKKWIDYRDRHAAFRGLLAIHAAVMSASHFHLGHFVIDASELALATED